MRFYISLWFFVKNHSIYYLIHRKLHSRRKTKTRLLISFCFLNLPTHSYHYIIVRHSLTLFFCLLQLQCSSTSKVTKSDHYDGEQFYNKTKIEKPSFFFLAKHIMFGRNGQWPDDILEPEADLALSKDLNENQVAVTFVNHATLLVQFKGYNVLTDPVWSKRVGPFSWAGPLRARKPGIPFDKLPKIDVVVISHNHYDHLDLPTLDKLEAKFHPLGDKDLLSSRNYQQVFELDWWQSKAFGKLKVVFTPAQHNSGRSLFDADESLWGGCMLQHNHHNIFFAGDTAYEKHFKEINKRLGNTDIAMLPIGAYLPKKNMQPFHTNPAEAIQAQLDLKARVAIAMHYGTFQLSNEDFDSPINDLKAALKKRNLPNDSFLALPEGKTKIFQLGKVKPIVSQN